MRTILLTNDDGIHAEGLEVAAALLRRYGRVVTVAPDRERSGSAHALTLTQPLRIQRLGADAYAIQGTPTDCVNLALHRLLEVRPDLVFAGINHGSNVGHDVTYSGTVCAAFEGALHGVLSVAVSLAPGGALRSAELQVVLEQILDKLLERGLPLRTLLNVNFPAVPPRGIRITAQADGGYRSEIVEKEDPRGGKYYWIGGKQDPQHSPPATTDAGALRAGFVAVTPLKLDLTCHASLEVLDSWRLGLEP